MTINALIFDFDGLILDTEFPEYDTWRGIYAAHNVDFPLDLWASIVGGAGAAHFDPAVHLQEQTNQDLDAITQRFKRTQRARIEAQPVLPGVMDYLDTACEMGLPLAIASSSPHKWVDGHLTRLGLYDYFDPIICADDVTRTKPDPELYLKALGILGVAPEEAVVFEDSPNGMLAAQRAGVFCVVVPNRLTRLFYQDGADLLLDSLADLPLGELLASLDS